MINTLIRILFKQYFR